MQYGQCSFGTPTFSIEYTHVISSKRRHSHLLFTLQKPWFLDGQLTSDFRESPHIDGSFLSKFSDYEPEDQQRKTLFLDWKNDSVVSKKGGFDIVEALSPEGIYGLLEQGKAHAKLMENKGIFQNLKKKYT